MKGLIINPKHGQIGFIVIAYLKAGGIGEFGIFETKIDAKKAIKEAGLLPSQARIHKKKCKVSTSWEHVDDY